jgi:hypothetical protein
LHFCHGPADPAEAESRGWHYIRECEGGVFGMWSLGGGFSPDGQHYDPTRRQQEKLAREAERAQVLEEWLTAGRGKDAVPFRNSPLPTQKFLLTEVFKGIQRKTAYTELPILWVPSAGHNRPAWAFPEVDGDGQLIGYSLRFDDNSKLSVGARGITVPARLRRPASELTQALRGRRPGSIYIVEGASDVLAMAEMGLDAIGRWSNTGGAAQIAEFLKKHIPKERWQIIVLGENDSRMREDGSIGWPGRFGALKVSQELSNELGIVVPIAMPPGGAKDVRSWFEKTLVKKGRNPANCGVTLANDLYLSTREQPQAEPGRPVPRPIPVNVLPLRPGAPLPARGGDGDSLMPATPAKPLDLSDLDEAGPAIAAAKAEAEAEAALPSFTRSPEVLAAQRVRHARADHDNFCCRCATPILTEHIATGNPTIIGRRCEDPRTCHGCRDWLKFREMLTIILRLSEAEKAGQTIYEGYVDESRWGAFREAKRAAFRKAGRPAGGGEHYAMPDPEEGRHYVATTTRLPDAWGFIPVPGGAATSIATFRTLVDAAIDPREGRKASQGWSYPSEEREPEYRRLGFAGTSNLERIGEIAESVGAEVETGRPMGPSKTMYFIKLWKRGGWDEESRVKVIAQVQAGELLPDFVCAPVAAGPPDPEPDDDGDPYGPLGDPWSDP